MRIFPSFIPYSFLSTSSLDNSAQVSDTSTIPNTTSPSPFTKTEALPEKSVFALTLGGLAALMFRAVQTRQQSTQIPGQIPLPQAPAQLQPPTKDTTLPLVPLPTLPKPKDASPTPKTNRTQIYHAAIPRTPTRLPVVVGSSAISPPTQLPLHKPTPPLWQSIKDSIPDFRFWRRN